MVKAKKLPESTAPKRAKKVKVPKLDAETNALPAQSDLSEIMEHWNDAAQRLMTVKVKDINEALNAFIEIVIEHSDLTGEALQAQREFLLDMLSLDEEFKDELKSVLKLKD